MGERGKLIVCDAGLFRLLGCLAEGQIEDLAKGGW